MSAPGVVDSVRSSRSKPALPEARAEDTVGRTEGGGCGARQAAELSTVSTLKSACHL